MFAVVRSGGKQYRVTENTRFEVEKLAAAPGETVTLGEVLMVGGADREPAVGAPLLETASVTAEVVEHKRDAKILIFKKKRRKNHRRLKGHRQALTVLRITGISLDGASAPVRSAAEAPEDAQTAAEAEAPPPAAAESASETGAEAAVEPAPESDATAETPQSKE